MFQKEPAWLEIHRSTRPYDGSDRDPASILRSETARSGVVYDYPKLLAGEGFNCHDTNTGKHVSPWDNGTTWIGGDGLQARLIQGINEDGLRDVLSRTTRATIGIHPDEPIDTAVWEDMLKGGLQTALESQVLVFEIIGASRVLTHQLVRTRKAAFHQQSQRATWYGDRPDFRMPHIAFRTSAVRRAWDKALLASWEAYKIACDAGVAYEDARYILPEGTTNYIICEYSVREFMNMFAYRGCEMFLWEMVSVQRMMKKALLDAHPFMEPYVKVSCETGPDCLSCGGTGKFSYANPTIDGGTWVEGIKEGSDCPVCDGLGGNRKCTFNGWENVEKVCSRPHARQSNRTFLPDPTLRIGVAK